MAEIDKSISFDGRDIRLKVGLLAPQAGGSVLIESGDTAVLVTATRSEAREGVDFLPLTVDYEERLYAAGRIPGGIMRREGRPPERAILTSRLIDRPLRPPLIPSPSPCMKLIYPKPSRLHYISVRIATERE